jgi:hypothetical protein
MGWPGRAPARDGASLVMSPRCKAVNVAYWHFATLQAEEFDVRFRGIPDFDDCRLSISLTT